jgi:integrase
MDTIANIHTPSFVALQQFLNESAGLNLHAPHKPIGAMVAATLASEGVENAVTQYRELRAHHRRTCARLCHASEGELEQIQFLLGHVSVQTTERYLGCKQRIRSAVNDRIGIEPNP